MAFTRFQILSLAALLSILLAAAPASAEHTRVTNPNAVSVEILGRAILYSVQYDHVLNDDMAAGFGLGKVGLNNANDTDSGLSVTMIPAYFNYYFTRDAGSLFATGGATLITNSSDANGRKSSIGGVNFNSTSVLPEVGLGYENRGDAGYLFRFAAYAVVAAKVAPWAGFAFGYAF